MHLICCRMILLNIYFNKRLFLIFIADNNLTFWVLIFWRFIFGRLLRIFIIHNFLFLVRASFCSLFLRLLLYKATLNKLKLCKWISWHLGAVSWLTNHRLDFLKAFPVFIFRIIVRVVYRIIFAFEPPFFRFSRFLKNFFDIIPKNLLFK